MINFEGVQFVLHTCFAKGFEGAQFVPHTCEQIILGLLLMHFEGVQFVTHAYICKTILCILFNAKGVQLVPYSCVQSVVPVLLFPEGVWVGWGGGGAPGGRGMGGVELNKPGSA